jgi:putative oxidoreductase
VRHAHPAPGRDAALLLARVVLGTIMLGYAYQQLGVLGRTGIEYVGILVAIFSASIVTVVEVVGALLLVAGLLTPSVAGVTGAVLVGAAAYVHVVNGVVGGGGWELVGAIVVALAALAAAGPGRFGLVHLVRRRRARFAPMPPAAPRGTPPDTHGIFDEPIPPPGLPSFPLVRLSPTPVRDRSSGPPG